MSRLSSLAGLLAKPKFKYTLINSTCQFFQVLNIFIIVKITKSARFRRQFRRQGGEEAQEVELEETSNSSRSRHLRAIAKLTHPGRQGHMSADSRSG